MTTAKLRTALAVYAVLALAGFTVGDGKLRLALWVFLAGLAAKSWVAWLAQRGDPDR
jgi:uncharacterized membrane protein